MLEHLKNTCAHSVTFTQRNVVVRTTHRVRHKSKKKRIETSTFRERRSSSGGLFNFLVGAAFHSTPGSGLFFFFFQRSAVIVVLHRSFRRGRPLSPWETDSRLRLFSSFSLYFLLFLFFFHVSSLLFLSLRCFLYIYIYIYERTYEPRPMSHMVGRSFPRWNLN